MRTTRGGKALVYMAVFPRDINERNAPVEIAWVENDAERPRSLLVRSNARWPQNKAYSAGLERHLARWGHLHPEVVDVGDVPRRLNKAWSGKTLVALRPWYEQAWLLRLYRAAGTSLCPWVPLNIDTVFLAIARQASPELDPAAVLHAVTQLIPITEAAALQAFTLALWARGFVDPVWRTTIFQAAKAKARNREKATMPDCRARPDINVSGTRDHDGQQ